MKITKDTILEYNYFSSDVILLKKLNCFYFEKSGVLDKYQIRVIDTGRVIVASENKDDLLSYLVDNGAELIKEEH